MQHGVWSCRIRVPPRALPLLAAAAALLPPIASAWAFRAPHDLGSRRLSLSCPAHRQRNAQRRVSLQHSPVVAQDLRDGMDEERNAQVAALKKSFYATSGDRTTSASEAEADSKQRWSLLGVLEDIPLCRWEMVMLPGALEFSPIRPSPLPIASVLAGIRPMGWRPLPGAPWRRRSCA
jgi:hypothetical protein